MTATALQVVGFGGVVAELDRATSALVTSRRLQQGIAAVCATRDLRSLDRVLLEVLSEVSGFDRVALLNPPTKIAPAEVRVSHGFPAVELIAIPPDSPFARGARLLRAQSGSDRDLHVPHYDCRGRYLIVPMLQSGNVVSMLYADELRNGYDVDESSVSITYLLEIAGLMRSNLTLHADRERMLAEMRSMARTDPLTALPNRRVFEERMEVELRRSVRSKEQFALAIVDLDHFKQINDTYGHAVGDEALRRFADTLRTNVRDVDLAARFAGDEFAVMLINTDSDGAATMITRLLEKIRSIELSVAHEITASIGFAVNLDDDTPETLFNRADRALFEAKRTGRDKAMEHKVRE